jgi:hypothetical protein
MSDANAYLRARAGRGRGEPVEPDVEPSWPLVTQGARSRAIPGGGLGESVASVFRRAVLEARGRPRWRRL